MILLSASLPAQETLSSDDNPLVKRGNAAGTLARKGDLDGAEKEYRAVVADAMQQLGPDAPVTLNLRIALAIVLRVKGDYAAAVAESQELLHRVVRVAGREHGSTMLIWANLGRSLAGQRKLEEAVSVFDAMLLVLNSSRGREHPDTLKARAARAEITLEQGRTDEAASELQRVLPLMEKSLGKDHPQTLAASVTLAKCWKRQGKNTEALDLLQRTRTVAAKRLGEKHPDTATCDKLLKEWRVQMR